MKKLIWGCTQMIVGMLGVIASLAAQGQVGGQAVLGRQT